LTNCPTFVENCQPSPGFGDHDTAALADILCHPQKTKPLQRNVQCWGKADMGSLRNEIKTEMHNFTLTESIHIPKQTVELFQEYSTICPKQTCSLQNYIKKIQSAWFNQDCKRMVGKKIQRYRIFKRTQLEKDWLKYKVNL